jgi:hypothetical protein
LLAIHLTRALLLDVQNPIMIRDIQIDFVPQHYSNEVSFSARLGQMVPYFFRIPRQVITSAFNNCLLFFDCRHIARM